jgi:hypothetical protein
VNPAYWSKICKIGIKMRKTKAPSVRICEPFAENNE